MVIPTPVPSVYGSEISLKNMHVNLARFGTENSAEVTGS